MCNVDCGEIWPAIHFYFEYFLPMRGDYWIDGALTGGRDPEKTARELNRIMEDFGYGTQAFIFTATGTADIAYTPEYNNTLIPMSTFTMDCGYLLTMRVLDNLKCNGKGVSAWNEK